MLNPDIAYLLGMLVGKGQIIRGPRETEIVIDIPHKNLVIQGENTQQSIKASLLDIIDRLKILVGTDMSWDTSKSNRAHISFTKSNGDYLIRTLNEYLANEISWRGFRIPAEVFSATTDMKKEFLRGLADVTAHVRKSNIAWNEYENRVYIELMGNWGLCIDVAILLQSLDVPIQTIRFAHPNIVDPNLKKYSEGYKEFWNKEHQIKIWAEEFEKIGFSIAHKDKLLKKFAELNRKNWVVFSKKSKKYTGEPISVVHHKFYWQTKEITRKKNKHPEEKSTKLPFKVRKHFNSWKEMAKELGYHD